MKITRSTTIVAFLASCFLAAVAAAESDTVLRSRLVGTWEELRIVDNERHEHRIALRNDGEFEVNGVLREGKKSTPFVWRGKWQVKNGKFVYTTTFSKPPEIYPLGESFSDTIVSVTETEWIMIEQSTGEKSRARRIK